MTQSAKKKNRSQEVVTAIHAFSNEAFTVAKAFVAGSDPTPLKQRAGDLRAQLPQFAARMTEADQAYREDLNRVLSEARLDLDYVLAGGGRPSSIRLSYVIREQSAG